LNSESPRYEFYKGQQGESAGLFYFILSNNDFLLRFHRVFKNCHLNRHPEEMELSLIVSFRLAE